MPSTGSIHNTGQFSQLISKDFDSVFFDSYKRTPEEYKAIAKVGKFDSAYIREGQVVGFGPMQEIGEGQPIPYEAMTQGNEKIFYPRDFALAAAITENLWDDDQKGIIKKVFQELGKAAAYTRELLVADLLNSGFVTTKRTGIDGAALFAAHTLFGPTGGTYTNYATTAGGLNVTSMQAAMDAFENCVNDNGIPTPMKPKLLVVPPPLRFEAESLLKSEYNPENANKQVNTVGNKGLEFSVNHYLTSSTAWFLLASPDDHDLRFNVRKPLALKGTDDFDTRSAKFRAVMRAEALFADFRGVYGNAGA